MTSLSVFVDSLLVACAREGWCVVFFRRPAQGAIEVIASTSLSPMPSVALMTQRGFVWCPYEGTGGIIVADVYLSFRGKEAVWTCSSHLPAFLQCVFDDERLSSGMSAALGGACFFEEETKKIAYIGMVEEALRHLAEGAFEKVVLSRVKRCTLGSSFSCGGSFARMNTLYANTFNYVLYSPGEGIWLGASPEPLLRIHHNKLYTQAMAATRQLLPKKARSVQREIPWRQKEHAEQRAVVRHIADVLQRVGISHTFSSPRTHVLNNIAHLSSTCSADFPPSFHAMVDELLRYLHPTPAVCGTPFSAASSFISAHEIHKRNYYTGYLGPVGIRSALTLYVNIRCALCCQGCAYLYAGAGIVTGSSPAAEWKETSLKITTVRHVLAADAS